MCALPAVQNLIQNVVVPPLVPVRCILDDDGIKDITEVVTRAMDASELRGRLPKGGSIAIGVGSRGMSRLPELVKATVDWFKKEGAKPFIIPCMGSHGGATAEGQAYMLKSLGIAEESAGCPIHSSMDVVLLGTLERGLPVYMDALAAAADGIFVINRVKLHTSFSGVHESGVVKMFTIGLGKQAGADSAHILGFGAFAEIMPEMTKLILATKKNVLGALATVENASEVPCLVEVVMSEELIERDRELLKYSATRMPAFPTAQLDVLILSRIGKDISGAGMDPNIIGRYSTPFKSGGPSINKIGILDISDASKGNATGMGNGDVITRRFAGKIDYNATYANVITATVPRSAAMPMVMDNDLDLFRCTIKNCMVEDPAKVRLLWARDTLTLDRFLVSSELLKELKNKPQCEVLGDPQPITFDKDGNIENRDPWSQFPGETH
jgi:hypothetical protein